MKAKLLLRIAAVLMFLHTIGHSFGALSWKAAPDAATGQVINAMQNVHFLFMGRAASFGSFYEGYGVSMILVLLLVSVLLWLLSNNPTTAPTAAIATLLAIFLLALAVTEYIYFFPFAAAFSLLAGISVLISRLQLSEK